MYSLSLYIYKRFVIPRTYFTFIFFLFLLCIRKIIFRNIKLYSAYTGSSFVSHDNNNNNKCCEKTNFINMDLLNNIPIYLPLLYVDILSDMGTEKNHKLDAWWMRKQSNLDTNIKNRVQKADKNEYMAICLNCLCKFE